MMNRIDNSGEGIARLGRDEDNYLAHVAQGEMVVPPVITPETRQKLEQEMMNMGLDPSEYTVGDGMSINPITGNPEFGFLKKIAKSLKKVVKKIAPIAAVIPGPWQGPAIMYNRGKAVINIAKGDGGIGELITDFTPNKDFTGGKTGNIFGNTKEFFTKGADGVGLFKNLSKGIGSLKDKAGEFVFAGDDDTNLFGNLRNMLTGETMYEDADGNTYTEDQINKMMDDGTLPEGANFTEKTSALEKLLGPDYADKLFNVDPNKGTGPFSFLGDGKGGLGNAGISGLAGIIAKMAYDEAKDFKGVPLTPLTTTDQLGRYNIAAESARKAGEEMPNRVEFGLNPSTLPVLQGGTPRGAAQGGIMAFAQGGIVAMANGGEPPIDPANFPVMNGEIDGPGTETSDDIPAMLSDGEFVMTAKAVKGAGGFDMNDSNGIVTLTPNGAPSRDSGTRVMYKLMEHFGALA